jgi:hypothetical protein
LDSEIVKELADKSLPIGAIFGYKPEAPQKDLIFEPCCCPTSADIRFAAGRLIADTDRAVDRIRRLLSADSFAGAEAIGRSLIDEDERGTESTPIEVEVELTTDDPYPLAVLRPRGASIPTRGPMSIACLRRLATELASRDDALCVLGGFGDPLRHPQLPAVFDALRPIDQDGVYGLAVRTSAVDLTDEIIDGLISHGVDVLNVPLDAWTPALYGALQTPGDQEAANLDAVLDNLTRLATAKAERQSVTPLVVPEFCKSRDNLHEMDDFYDGWMRRLGIASLTGFNHFGHRVPDRGVIQMAPSRRTPCRRVRSRAMVLADGRLTLCDQDFEGAQTIGDLGQASLAESWSGVTLSKIRGAHFSDSTELPEVCRRCDEWHRP